MKTFCLLALLAASFPPAAVHARTWQGGGWEDGLRAIGEALRQERGRTIVRECRGDYECVSTRAAAAGLYELAEYASRAAHRQRLERDRREQQQRLERERRTLFLQQQRLERERREQRRRQQQQDRNRTGTDFGWRPPPRPRAGAAPPGADRPPGPSIPSAHLARVDALIRYAVAIRADMELSSEASARVDAAITSLLEARNLLAESP